jgi:hypothetical protein
MAVTQEKHGRHSEKVRPSRTKMLAMPKPNQ